MVDPKNEPGFEPEHSYPDRREKDTNEKPYLKNKWRDRMRSNLLRMSRGAQNFWRSLPWPHNENWRRKNKKK